MARTDLLGDLADSCKQLRDFFSPPGRAWLDALAKGKKDDADASGKKNELDSERLFELFCYFDLVASLSQEDAIDLNYVQGNGTAPHRFPYAPGKKANFARFTISVDSSDYDLCSGTQIPVPDEPSEAPDISLQAMDGVRDKSKAVPPVAIWDAKYHQKHGISKADIGQMNYWADIFEESLLKYSASDILAKHFPDPFTVSAVVTNAPAPDKGKTANRSLMLRKGFSMACQFGGCGETNSLDPTRTKHLSHPRNSKASS